MTDSRPAHWWRDRAACKTAPLSLVDEAFDRPGSDAGKRLREDYCRRCPVGEQCLAEAMERGEIGIWGGTSSRQRVRHGGNPYKVRTNRIPKSKQPRERG